MNIINIILIFEFEFFYKCYLIKDIFYIIPGIRYKTFATVNRATTTSPVLFIFHFPISRMGLLWRAGTKLSILASAIGGGTAAALIATSDDPATALKLSTSIPRRLFDDAIAAANIVFGTVDLTKPSLFPMFIWNLTKSIYFSPFS